MRDSGNGTLKVVRKVGHERVWRMEPNEGKME